MPVAIGVVFAGVDRIVILCDSVAVIFEMLDDVDGRVVKLSGRGSFVRFGVTDEPGRKFEKAL